MLDVEETAVKQAIARVVSEGTHYASAGHPNVANFETELSKHFNGAPVLGVNSGTDALILALKVLGVTLGDEVIVPAFSYISTASCVSWVGATPVFVDICPADFAINPLKIKEKITKNTKAIIVAHLFGQPALGTKDIIDIAKQYNLFVIEDAAQSFGAEIEINGEWKHIGTVGDIGCFSFSSTKPFAAPGNGGAIIFNIKNQGLVEKADQMRFYGAKIHYYDYPVSGVCAKLQEIQAAALLAKMPFIDYWLKKRKDNAQCYTKTLFNVNNILLPQEGEKTKRIWYRYVIRTKDRNKLFDYLKTATDSNGHLQPMKNYPVPLPYFSAFEKLGYIQGDFPVADQLSSEVISLPLQNIISPEDVKNVCDSIKYFYKFSG